GDAEGLQAQLAGRDPGKVFSLLLLVAVPEQRAHDVHLRVAGGTVGAGVLDFLQDRRGSRERQPGTTIFLGDEDGEITGSGKRLHKLGRIGAVAVNLAPVFRREGFAELPHAFPDLPDFLALRKVADRHELYSS